MDLKSPYIRKNKILIPSDHELILQQQKDKTKIQLALIAAIFALGAFKIAKNSGQVPDEIIKLIDMLMMQ